MLVNLPRNAVKFTPECGSSGKLLRTFGQLDSSLVRRHSGTGLGLVLVKRMAELHSEHVGAESSPGQESRCCLSLPWRAPETVHTTRQVTGQAPVQALGQAGEGV